MSLLKKLNKKQIAKGQRNNGRNTNKYQDSKMTKAGIFGVLGFLLYVLAAAASSELRDGLGCVLSLIFAIASTCLAYIIINKVNMF